VPGVPGMPRRQAKVRLGSAFGSSASGGFKVLQTKRPAGDDPEWLRGFGFALAEIRRLQDCSTAINEVMHNAGVTPETLTEAGLEAFDLNEIKACYRRRRR